MLRALAIVIACHGVARADSGVQIEGRLDSTLVLGPPADLPLGLSPADRARRAALYEAAVPATLHPLARANLWLALGDLDLATAVESKRMYAERLAAQDFAGAIQLEGEIGAALAAAARDYTRATSSKHARWRGLPRALAHHAYALDLAKSTEALVVHRRITTDHPASPYAARSHVVLGDVLLAAERNAEASAHYRAVVTDDPLLRAYAMFGRGTVLLATRAPERAYDAFVDALALAPPPLLAAEVRAAIAQAYAQFGAADRAFETFAKLAPPHAQDMTVELAALLRTTDIAASAVVYAGLVRRFPNDAAVCTWQIAVTQAANLGTDPAVLFREVERLVRIFARKRFVLVDAPLLVCRRMTHELTTGLAQKTIDKALSRQLRDLARGVVE